MKNKKVIMVVSAVILALVLLVSLAANLYARQIRLKNNKEAAKYEQSIPANKEVTRQDNYSLTCKLINVNEQSMSGQRNGYQALVNKLRKDLSDEFEIKVENNKVSMWGVDSPAINNDAANLTFYIYGHGGAIDELKTVSIDKSTGNGFFTWTEMFPAENTMISAVISCIEK
jgi:hypothetical protein